MIKVLNLSHSYDKKHTSLVDFSVNITFNVNMAIVGPNGAGKSTLLKVIMKSIKNYKGSVFIDEKVNIAYVPQTNNIDWDFPITVLDVVVMGTYKELSFFQKVGKSQIEKAKNALKKVDMLDYIDRQISELSGGQKQRVFLARALCEEANLYLLDEPFQGIDKKTEEKIVEILKKLHEEGKSIIVVHHDLNTVSKYFDEVLMINKRNIAFGKVKEVFTNENLIKTFEE